MKVRPTCTDSAGNGYYQGTDGKIYYGNVKMRKPIFSFIGGLQAQIKIELCRYL